MTKTLELRKIITERLNTTQGGTYYRTAPKDEPFPYKTYELTSVAFPDCNRDDFELCVDIWYRGSNANDIEVLADQIEQLFNNANLPQETILPTFYRESRYFVDDPDKTLMHIQLRFSVQLYEQEV